ncbi:hypothetical protein DCAR_0519855 [Daucus carota subsp. sativus]|uniref:Uncharacterized protein n=1 Tax=Daucus carota subsp. sativus TaxID=79200 RepID=A0A161XR94_DAUCS|nr:hypothetical protein DCAR_0519855 [Daucus carota subsp. sativus]
MDSNTQMNLLQLTNENASMEERIKMLQAENSILEHKIKLMEIQQTHDEAVVTVLKNHIEERRAFNRLLRDDSNFSPSEMERHAQIREEIINEHEAKKRAKVSPKVDEQEKK